MEAIIKKIFQFQISIPESPDLKLYESKEYIILKKNVEDFSQSTSDIIGKKAFNVALEIISAQIAAKENHGLTNANIVGNELDDNIENLTVRELCILSDYIGLFKKLTPKDNDEDYLKTEKGELIHYSSVCNQIKIYLIQEIDLYIGRLKVFLFYALPKSFWHELYGARREDSKEDIDSIVSSILN